MFDIDSYGSIDIVTDFSTGLGDAIDIRDLLDGYDSGTDDVIEWVRITTSGAIALSRLTATVRVPAMAGHKLQP